MPSPREMTLEELKDELPKRLKLREYKDAAGEVYAAAWTVALRGPAWNNIGPLVLHKPDPKGGWTDTGPTTDDLATAMAWLHKDGVVRHIYNRLRATKGPNTVRAVMDSMLKAMSDDPDVAPKTIETFTSIARSIIIPHLGGRELARLTFDEIEKFINDVQVRDKTRGLDLDGQPKLRPASPNYKSGIRSVLTATWHHGMGRGTPVPWAGMRITRKGEKARRRELAKSAHTADLIEKRTYTPGEVMRILATARSLDRLRAGDRFHRGYLAANAAATIALQLGFGTRIAELMDLRWVHLDEERGFALIPGTKSGASIRYLPLQDSLKPWLALLRRLPRYEVKPADHVLQTYLRAATAPSLVTYSKRIDAALKAAGLKFEQQRTHIFRRTHASIAAMHGADAGRVKWFLGHSDAWGGNDAGVTGDYIQFIESITRQEDRRYLPLPSPEEVDEYLETWTPPHLPPRKQKPAKPPRKRRSTRNS